MEPIAIIAAIALTAQAVIWVCLAAMALWFAYAVLRG